MMYLSAPGNPCSMVSFTQADIQHRHGIHIVITVDVPVPRRLGHRSRILLSTNSPSSRKPPPTLITAFHAMISGLAWPHRRKRPLAGEKTATRAPFLINEAQKHVDETCVTNHSPHFPALSSRCIDVYFWKKEVYSSYPSDFEECVACGGGMFPHSE